MNEIGLLRFYNNLYKIKFDWNAIYMGGNYSVFNEPIKNGHSKKKDKKGDLFTKRNFVIEHFKIFCINIYS